MRGLWIRLTICIFVFGTCLYSYIDRHNHLTKLKMQLPELQKAIQSLEEENKRLAYEVDQFENPTHLMELASHPEFSHLKHPFMRDILTIPEGVALHLEKESSESPSYVSPSISLAVGAN